jgi:hypothetical protein
MSNNTILKALERMNYKDVMTGHGFGWIASTLLHEQGHNHDHNELKLVHGTRNAVSAAYNYALYALLCSPRGWRAAARAASSDGSPLGIFTPTGAAKSARHLFVT